MSLVLRADERGVMFNVGVVSLLLGVLGAFTRGVGGSVRTAGVLELAGLVVVDALAGTRGVRGLRAVRVAASVGFKGRPAFRSVDIGASAGLWRSHSSGLALQQFLPLINVSLDDDAPRVVRTIQPSL